ncbi:ImmA/IrrE family metallo-endopeptidase [Enterococcus faecalis]|uniref:ImmA/IrrE family metallo-endopeptidase n=1 Tax=Enterococcus faecalis TaxID=1351 RepID=UPI00035453A2|nr:ImmA/IrrE family metallo-endopeptidase [Enterococcus faecalis]EPI39915.1 toxin-antitoxin system, toxin component domain protein [Enterococcus faecalis LA3B-2]
MRKIIRKLNVNIEKSFYLDGDGHYIPNLNTIVLNANLDERNELIVLLHELGHAAKHQEDYILYNRIFSYHSKMECQADEYMIKHLLEFYLDNPEVNPTSVNAIAFLEMNDLDLSYEQYVRDLLYEHVLITKSH